jgi:cysteine desulfurase
MFSKKTLIIQTKSNPFKHFDKKLLKYFTHACDTVQLNSTNRNLSSMNFSLSKNDLGKKTIFLDFQSTTPLDPRVLDAMLPYMTLHFGNPHSKSHEYGWDAEKAVEKAREQIATLIGADSKEIIFTSGATESNNMAIKGVSEFYKEKKKHIITTQTVIKN